MEYCTPLRVSEDVRAKVIIDTYRMSLEKQDHWALSPPSNDHNSNLTLTVFEPIVRRDIIKTVLDLPGSRTGIGIDSPSTIECPQLSQAWAPPPPEARSTDEGRQS